MSDQQEVSRQAVECTQPAPPPRRHSKALKLVLVVTALFMLVEIVGGVFANSLALLADAEHMLTDVGALALALFAAWFARRPATPEKTYGYLRLEILAALVNGTVLFIVAIMIVRDAIGRFAAPPDVQPVIMTVVAGAGLVVNVFGARVLHAGHRESLNVRGAYFHVLGDLLGSIGALTAGIIILTTGWVLADPVISLGIAVLICVGAWRLVRESVDVLLEATPRHIAMDNVERAITTIDDVDAVHDLHVWTLTSGVIAMSGHAVVCDPDRNQSVLEKVQVRLADLGIHHVTLQIERSDTCG